MLRVIDDRKRASSRYLVITLSTIAVALNIYLTYGFPYPPLQDYMEWMIQGRMIHEILTGAGNACAEIRRYPVPNSFIQLALSVANSVTSMVQAGRIVLSSYVILACIAIWKFTTRYSPQGRLISVVLTVTIFFGFPFWSGLLNFQIGLLGIAFYLCLPQEKQHSPFYALAFSLPIFFSHAIPWAAFLLIVLARAPQASYKNKIYLILALTPSMMMALVYVYVRDENSLNVSQPSYYSIGKHLVYKIYTFTKIGPYHNWIVNGVGDFERYSALVLLGLLINLGYATLVGIVLRDAFRKLPWKDGTGKVLLLLMLAFIAAPHHAFGVVNPGERFLYVFILLALSLGPRGPTRSASTLLCIAFSSVFVIANLSIVTRDISFEDAFSYQPAFPPKIENIYWVAPLQFNQKFQYIEKQDGAQLSKIAIDFLSGPLRAKAACDHSSIGQPKI